MHKKLNNQLATVQIPLKVRMYSTISVPLETKQLIRRIQRAEKLTVSINLQVRCKALFVMQQKFSCFQKNLNDTEKGRHLLESIDLICTGEQYFPPPVSPYLSFENIKCTSISSNSNCILISNAFNCTFAFSYLMINDGKY